MTSLSQVESKVHLVNVTTTLELGLVGVQRRRTAAFRQERAWVLAPGDNRAVFTALSCINLVSQ